MTDTDAGKRLSDAELVFALRTIGDRPIETAEGICAQAADTIERLTANRGSVSEDIHKLDNLLLRYWEDEDFDECDPETMEDFDTPEKMLAYVTKELRRIAAIQQAMSECSGGGAGTVSLSELWLITKGALPVKASERFQTQAELQAWAIGIKDALAGAAKLIESRALPLPPSPVKESRNAALEIPKTVTAYEAVVRLMEREGKPIAAAIWQSNADALKTTPHQGGEGK